jgi:hypothetical protein
MALLSAFSFGGNSGSCLVDNAYQSSWVATISFNMSLVILQHKTHDSSVYHSDHRISSSISQGVGGLAFPPMPYPIYLHQDYLEQLSPLSGDRPQFSSH